MLGCRHAVARLVMSLLLLLLPAVARAWHASLGQLATPKVHATSQRGDLELPRSADVISDPCLTVTTTLQKLHLVCNATCATEMPCDWSCQATWNSFLRDVHSMEDQHCPGYVEFLEQKPLGASMVPLPSGATISLQYLYSLVVACQKSCPQDARSDYPCGVLEDSGTSSMRKCVSASNPENLAACFPLKPATAECAGGSFKVTDGKHWFPFVTWSVVAYYKKNHMGNTGGLYAADGSDRDEDGLEKNEYSSWVCLYEETCGAMMRDRKLGCFRYSHLRGEFHWWKWSDTSPELKEMLDVWTVKASFCDLVPGGSPRSTFVDARDRSVRIVPKFVEYSFDRMHMDGAYRPAIIGLLSDLGDGCNGFELQRDLQYMLEVNASDYFTSIGPWISPSKADIERWVRAGKELIPLTVPMFPKRDVVCSSLAFTLSWCTTSPTDVDLVLFQPRSRCTGRSTMDRMFVPDTCHALMNGKRMTGQTKYTDDSSDPSYSIEVEMDDDGTYYNDQVRTYGPETIYAYGDLPNGTYAVMAYVMDPQGQFTGGCERITMYSGLPGRDRQVASASVGTKAGTGNWWHAFNIRVKYREVPDMHGHFRYLKGFEYAVVDKLYVGPTVCSEFCGIGGDLSSFLFQPAFEDMKENWKMNGVSSDPRKTRSVSYLNEEEDGYKTLFLYQPYSHTCEPVSYVEIRALDALTHTYLSDATFRVNDTPKSYNTSRYRLIKDVTGDYVGGFLLPRGQHKFEVSRAGYRSEVYQLLVPQVCEGSNCLSTEIIYQEIYMIPNDGKTRVVLNWGDVPYNLDILVMPVGVLGRNGEPLNWRTGSGSAVRVYDTSGIGIDAVLQGTTNYGAGREPYASQLLTDLDHSMQKVIMDDCTLAPTSLCRCEHTCSEDTLHRFVCTHYQSSRMPCSEYENEVVSKLLLGYPRSKAGQAPLCVDMKGNVKQACCCNLPNANGVITCEDGASDAWCCPVVDEIPSSFCTPTCYMRTANTTIETTLSIDRNENFHNMPKRDTSCKYVNRPEVASLSHLVPGMYKIFANAFSPTGATQLFGSMTVVKIYLGNGHDRTVLVDTITLPQGTSNWLYAGYIMVTSEQQSCLATNKMLQKKTIDGRTMCYNWHRAGYQVNSPLNLQYGAVRIRIAAASGRTQMPLPDFSGVQYSVHAGGSCTCMPEGGVTGCRCIGSALVHAGLLGPTEDSDEEAEGWAIGLHPIYFPVESGQEYWMIFAEAGYFDSTIRIGFVNFYTLEAVPMHTVVMTDRVDEGQLRIVFTWKAISDGDMYVFRGPLPIRYLGGTQMPVHDPLVVWWDDPTGLDGVKLEQDCTTKECGIETIFFDDSPVHDGMMYTVAANVYAGVDQDSVDGKCTTSAQCHFQGRDDDETVQFWGRDGPIAVVKYQRSGEPVDWWYVAEVYRQNSVWVVESKNQRAYCTPNVSQPDITSFMSPNCTV